MINISEAFKSIYRNDVVPLVQDNVHKDLILYFPGIDYTITNPNIVSESFELDEAIFRSDTIRFGACEAALVKITVADIDVDLSGQTMVVTQIVDGTYEMPLGVYKVDSCKRRDNLWFRDIVAYGLMRKFDVDVAEWYRGLFPSGNETYTLSAFRANLLSHIGIQQDASSLPLPNDSMIVTKTIDPTQISGRAVIEACQEINGVFGQIGRDGKFTHAILMPAYGLYPSNDLYPSDDLYPIAENDTSFVQGDLIDETITVDMRKPPLRFEEYTCKEIDKLIVRSEENDVGAIIGTGANAYVVEGNFLLFGKSAVELELIARNIFGSINKRPHRPYDCDSVGLPYITPGDMLAFPQSDTVTGYVFQRTLKGIQKLRDSFIDEGKEEIEQNFGLNKEIIQLQGRTTTIQKSVDGVSIEVADLAEDTSAQFVIAYNSIALKVDKNGVIAAINISPETVKIQANNIELEGIVTANSRFKILLDGSMEATSGKFSGELVAATGTFTGTLNGNIIIAPSISGGTISGAVLISTDGSRTTRIANGGIVSDYAGISFLEATTQLNVGGGVLINASDRRITSDRITCYDLNGGVPVTSANISSQVVGYANNAGSVSSLNGHTTNEITATNTGYGNIDFQGFDNAAGVNWAQNNFQPKTPSDVRLKYDIQPMNDIPDELFYSLKPYQFRYKTDQYGNKKYFGIIAQQLENAFAAYGLNPNDYDLFEVKNVRAYTDDGYFIKKETHRINYYNLFGWMIKIMKNQNTSITNQNARITELENIIKSLI